MANQTRCFCILNAIMGTISVNMMKVGKFITGSSEEITIELIRESGKFLILTTEEAQPFVDQQ